MRVGEADRRLGAGGASGGATRGAILRGRFVVSNRLEEQRQENIITNTLQEGVCSG